MNRLLFLVCLIALLLPAMTLSLGCGDDDGDDEDAGMDTDTDTDTDTDADEDAGPDSGEVEDAVFSCEVIIEWDNVSCLDMREADGWNETEAGKWCDAENQTCDCGAGPVICNEECSIATVPELIVGDEAGSCKNTVNKEIYVKRCTACETVPSGPIPRLCKGKDYYIYSPDGFPDWRCTDLKGGEVEAPPWPAY